jgi:hypothetical protein
MVTTTLAIGRSVEPSMTWPRISAVPVGAGDCPARELQTQPQRSGRRQPW